jgi:hypothetical protein
MTIRERDIHIEEQDGVRWEDIPWKKGTAIAIWLVAVWCTKQVTADFFPRYVDWFAALLIQAALTFAESPIWRRNTYDWDKKKWVPRRIDLINIAAVTFDAILNMVGVWYFVRMYHKTATAQAIGEMFGTQPPPASGIVAFVACFIIGVALCAIPEKLFYDED